MLLFFEFYTLFFVTHRKAAFLILAVLCVRVRTIHTKKKLTNMGNKKNNKVEKITSSSSVQSDTVIIDIIQLHINQLHLFHRIIEIANEVDDLTRVRVNRIELTLIDNLDNAMEEEEMEEEEEVEEEIEEVKKENILENLEDSSPSPPLECSVEEISFEIIINQLNFIYPALIIEQEDEEEEEE